MIGVDGAATHDRAGERRAAVCAVRQHEARLPDAVVVGRIDDHAREVEGALDDVERIVDEAPVLAEVVGAIESRLLRLDQRVEHARVRRRHGHGDAAEVSGGHPVRHLLPVLAAVRRLVEAAAGAAGAEEVGLPAELPHAGVDDVRHLRVEREI